MFVNHGSQRSVCSTHMAQIGRDTRKEIDVAFLPLHSVVDAITRIYQQGKYNEMILGVILKYHTGFLALVHGTRMIRQCNISLAQVSASVSESMCRASPLTTVK